MNINNLRLLGTLLCLSAISAASLQARVFMSAKGDKLEGDIVKNFGDYILFKRSSDHQLFRFKTEILCDKDQAFVKNNFAPIREEIPKFQRPLAPNLVTQLAGGIDGILINKMREYQKGPNSIVSDEVFLRRTYLKIIGRIPTLEETKSFLDDLNRGTKRAKLVDKLLDSEGYVSNWFHFWADILRAKDRIQGTSGPAGRPYVTFIKDFIRSNKAYDVFVRELISSEGPVWEKGSGAVGYYFRDRGMPLDNMSNTVRIFLGTSLECAQCHDHPFDRWTQKQFYEMAAFTHGVGSVNRKMGMENLASFNKLVRQEADEDGKLRRASRMVRDILQFGLDNPGEGKIRLPRDYQYDNAKPNEQVEARTIFGLTVELDENLEEIGSRETYANWLASDANPRFTTVIANRLWKQVMGIGLIEPVDNMMDDTTATNPALMAYLEKTMYALDYDLKEFLRVLYNTKAFQRAAPKQEYSLSSEVPFLYQGPIINRMTAEQIWDSLLTLTYPDVDLRKVDNEPMEYDKFVRYSAMSGEQLLAEVAASINGGGQRMERPNRTTPNANAKPTNVNCPIKPGRAADPSIVVMDEEGKPVALCCNGCKRTFTEQVAAKVARASKPPAQKDLPEGSMPGGPKFQYVNARQVRASELSSPAPVGHLVREFGGSDREQIQNGHRDASVTQVLALLNGYVENSILRNKKATAMQALESEHKVEDKVKNVYYTILNRKPDSRERRIAAELVKSHGDEAYKDLIWILINSHEFLFVQ